MQLRLGEALLYHRLDLFRTVNDYEKGIKTSLNDIISLKLRLEQDGWKAGIHYDKIPTLTAYKPIMIK